MVDHSEENSFSIPRRAGKERRDRIKHKWSYKNPFNRIHGYIFLTDVTSPETEGRKVVSISIICSSIFSNVRGVGSALMRITESRMRELGFTDIVLEVANDHAERVEEWYEEEEEEEEEDEEDEEEEEDFEDLVDVISHEFWRKTMRKVDGEPYYNLEKEYIDEALWEYFLDEGDFEEISNRIEVRSLPGDISINRGVVIHYWSTNEDEEEDEEEIVSDEPEEYEYGGYWYQKGKASSKQLMGFYEHFGFHEDPKVHLRWKCFTHIPYPSMRKIL